MKTNTVLFSLAFILTSGYVSHAQEGAAIRTEEYVVTYKYDIALSGFVDMGLSVKWAACNVGASSPEFSGHYFAWGEVEPTDYNDIWPSNPDWQPWLCYDHYRPGDPFSKGELLKYNSDPELGAVDNKVILDSEDDAAYIATQGAGRTPTAEEFQELLDRCRWDFITYKGSWGAVVTGPNGAQIFMDAVGMMVAHDTCTEYMTADLYGDSMRCPVYCIGADGMTFTNDARCRVMYERSYCFNVRPVCDK